MTNNRLNIGLFTCHLDNDYAQEICKGAEYAARESDVNLIVFPGMFLSASFYDPANQLYDYQYNSIFYYANRENLDGLIISIGSIADFLSEKDIESFLAGFEGIPILTLERKIPGYPCIQADSTTGLREAINHLISVHGRRKICFVGGPKDNDDAVNRLEVYKEVLAANELPLTEDMMVFGDFSEYSRNNVAKLLDCNPDCDAIVFANDQMAIGGYAELKSRGIKIGPDISVIGFDDSPVAVTMDPPLSTVNARSSDVGYRAVLDMVGMCGSADYKTSFLESGFIKRTSCNCDMADAEEVDFDTLAEKGEPVENVVDMLCQILLGNIGDSFYSPWIFDNFKIIFTDIVNVIMDPDNNAFPKHEIIDRLNIMLHSPMISFFSVSKIGFVFRRLTALYTANTTNYDKKASYHKLDAHITSTISQFLSTQLYTKMKDNITSTWSSTYITRDTLTNGDDEEKSFSLILNKLKELSFDSSYIYLYDKQIKINEDGSWTVPKYLYLQAYYNQNNTDVLSGEARRTPSYELFDNEYTYYPERFTDVIVPIFTNEQHHGLFICNTTVDNFNKIYTTSLQLGASLKYLSLLREQKTMQNKLMMSLNEIHEKNELLSMLSTSDELTGVNNRRGFMDKVEFLIKSPANNDRNAMMLFADMDSLKVVNDRFGHKDGDFALKNIATILSASFRPADIIGRIGGDEFVCFAFVDDTDFIADVQDRINELSDELNETCGKPYFIEMSVGISEFHCNNNMKIEDLLSQADNALYSNKRYKRMSVIKQLD